MTKLAISNGAVFLVPVAPTGYAVGVLILADGRGRAVGAFFGPRVNRASDVSLADLRVERALLICRFGDRDLRSKRWPVVGTIPNWSHSPWSVTKFSRRHDKPELCYVTEYDETLNPISECVLPASEGKMLPEDAMYGSSLVEATLTRLVI